MFAVSIFNVEDGTELYRMNFAGRLDDAVSLVGSALIITALIVHYVGVQTKMFML